MNVEINANEIIEKLQKRISQDAKMIAVMEATIDVLKNEINTIKEESTLQIK